MFFKGGIFFLTLFVSPLSVLIAYNSLTTYNKNFHKPDKVNEFNCEENITQVASLHKSPRDGNKWI